MHRWTRLGLDADAPASAVRIVQALVLAEFLQGLGASAVLPLLPLYLRRHGTSVGMVGAVIAAYFVAGMLTQYGAGHLADAVGHRFVIVLGLALYAVGSAGFVAHVGDVGYVVLRGLQGAGFGGLQVGGAALVGVVVPLSNRGRAFAIVSGAQFAGLAIGPAAGSVVGVGGLRWLFMATAAMSLAASVPVLIGAPAHVLDSHEERRGTVRMSPELTGLLLVAVVAGLIFGVYETCWSLLMNSRNAAAWQIGVSWTLFALPFAAFSPIAGRLVDHLDRRWLAIVSLVVTCGFAATYPFLTHVWLLMALGTIEAIGVAISAPAAQSMLSQTVAADALGRVQGVYTTTQTAALSLAAAVSGAMFAAARWLPFTTAAAVGVGLSLTLPWWWRSMPAHATPTARVAALAGADVAAAGAVPAPLPPPG